MSRRTVRAICGRHSCESSRRKQPDTMAVQKYDIKIPGDGFEARYWSPRNYARLRRRWQRSRTSAIASRMSPTSCGWSSGRRAATARGDAVVASGRHATRDLSSRAGDPGGEPRARRRSPSAAGGLSSQTHDVEKLGRVSRARMHSPKRRPRCRCARRVSVDRFARATHAVDTAHPDDRYARADASTRPSADTEDGTNLLIARRQLDRLCDLVEEMLEVSRITAGSLTLQLEEADFVASSDALRKSRHEAETAGCRARFSAPPSLAGRWDRARIRQVAISLISNAIKYGRGKPVTVEVSGTDSHVVLATTDQGIGIPPDKRDRSSNVSSAGVAAKLWRLWHRPVRRAQPGGGARRDGGSRERGRTRLHVHR